MASVRLNKEMQDLIRCVEIQDLTNLFRAGLGGDAPQVAGGLGAQPSIFGWVGGRCRPPPNKVKNLYEN